MLNTIQTVQLRVNNLQHQDKLAGLNNIIHALLKSKRQMSFSIPIMKRLFDTFIHEAYISVQELLAAAEKNNITIVKSIAHDIRGSGLSLNFTEISEICRVLVSVENINTKIHAKELKKKIDEMYHRKDTILEKLTELE